MPGQRRSRAAISTGTTVRLDYTNWSCKTIESCQSELWRRRL